MKELVEIIMKRDSMSKVDALSLVQETKSEIHDVIASGSWYLVEDIMMGNLGLEMDYIDRLL